VSEKPDPRARCRGLFAALLHCMGVVVLALWALGAAAAPPPLVADSPRELDLMRHGRLYEANGSEPPSDPRQIDAWLADMRPVPRIDMLGGRYWLHAVVRNESRESAWVVDPNGSLVERIQVRVLMAGHAPQRFDSGYETEDAPYMLHYGGDVTLPPGAQAHVLVMLDSRYYARYPGVALLPQVDYRRLVLSDNVVALAALGAVAALGLYNLFVAYGARDRAALYYSLSMLSLAGGWGLSFHLGAQWLQWHDLRWHYVGFFLMPVFTGLFFIEFLQLQRLAPRLTRATRANIVLSLVFLPSCFISAPLAHWGASLAVLVVFVLGMAASWISMASGFKPARYFVAAFGAHTLAAVVILPSNLGLVENPVRNVELPALMGAAADALLLAFALADKIRHLSRQKDEYLQRLNRALDQTRTDHLTGILNRHAFDQMLALALTPGGGEQAPQVLLVIIDLDGLKAINDARGHTEGDALLCAFARLLGTLRDERTAVFRLGGDEFAVLGHPRDEARLCAALPMLEARLRADGFPDSGVSFGMAFGYEAHLAEALIQRADSRMYAHKAGKRTERPVTAQTPRRRAADRAAALRDSG
jgi:diguanylate cyclase (GGDEF)-like protein